MKKQALPPYAKKIMFLFYFISVFLISLNISANVQWGKIHNHYINPRAMGMGNAFTAISNDYSAVLYNPAALSRRTDTEVNLSIDGSVTSSFFDFYENLNSASQATNKFQAYYDLLSKNYGKNFSARLGLFHGFIAAPGWGIAVVPLDFTTDLMVVNQAFPSLAVRMFGDTTIAFGIGKRIYAETWEGKVDWGITGKFVNRAYVNLDYTILDLALNSSNLISNNLITEGYTLDADFGLLYSPFLSDEGIGQLLQLAKPTFSLVIRNILGGQFNHRWGIWGGQNNNMQPESLYRVLDIGSRWEYPELWIFGGRGSLDIRNIGHPHFNFKKGLHLGFEFDWSMASWWKGQYRVGLNQGYLTLGMSALFTIFRLDLVSYGEEIGSAQYPLENRTYMVRMNMEF